MTTQNTTVVAVSPLSVAPKGTESGGDARAQVKDTPDQAMDRVMNAAVRLLGTTQAAEAALLDALCEIAMASHIRQAWTAVHKARQLLDNVRDQELVAVRTELDELYLFPFRGAEAHSPFIGEMLSRFDAAIDRANKAEGRVGEVTNLRQAVEIGRRLVNSRIGRQISEARTTTPAQSQGKDPERAKRESARRARQLERSVGPKGPSGQSGPQHGNKKGGKK